MTEDIKVIAETLGCGDVEERLWEIVIDYAEKDRAEAIAHFHKLKRVYEIFEIKCPFILVQINDVESNEKWYTYIAKNDMADYINDERFTVVEK